jgi:hypothetical protein
MFITMANAASWLSSCWAPSQSLLKPLLHGEMALWLLVQVLLRTDFSCSDYLPCVLGLIPWTAPLFLSESRSRAPLCHTPPNQWDHSVHGRYLDWPQLSRQKLYQVIEAGTEDMNVFLPSLLDQRGRRKIRQKSTQRAGKKRALYNDFTRALLARPDALFL